MMAFVMGADRSRASVDEMHRILMNRFSHDTVYSDLTTAVASFVPGGAAPFYDEARLAEEFRVFLRDRKIFVPDAPQERAGVWPPPPSIGAPYKNDRDEKK